MPFDEDEPRGRGRPPYEPNDEDRDRVVRMAAYGIKQEVMASIIGISHVTLRKYYEHELAIGLSRVVIDVADSLIEKSKSDRPDAVNAAKFFLQSRGDWAEKTEDVTAERHEERVERRKAAVDRGRGRRDADES